MRLTKVSFQIIKFLIALFAYSYIFWKIYVYRKTVSEFYNKHNFDDLKLTILILVFLMMILNWFIESYKWKILVKKIKKISIKHSFKAVIAGISTGIFTPNRIGEFVGRPYFTDKNQITSSVFAGFAGSLSQSLITVLLGISALNMLFLSNKHLFSGNKQYFLLAISITAAVVLLYLFFNLHIIRKLAIRLKLSDKYKNELKFLNNYAFRDLWTVLLLSFLRYIVFFSQFYLLLIFFDVAIYFYETLIAIPLIYLVLLVVPSVAFSEMGIRSSLSVFFIGMYSNNFAGILAASILLWIINLALPAFVGTFVVLKEKYKGQ